MRASELQCTVCGTPTAAPSVPRQWSSQSQFQPHSLASFWQLWARCNQAQLCRRPKGQTLDTTWRQSTAGCVNLSCGQRAAGQPSESSGLRRAFCCPLGSARLVARPYHPFPLSSSGQLFSSQPAGLCSSLLVTKSQSATGWPQTVCGTIFGSLSPWLHTSPSQSVCHLLDSLRPNSRFDKQPAHSSSWPNYINTRPSTPLTLIDSSSNTISWPLFHFNLRAYLSASRQRSAQN